MKVKRFNNLWTMGLIIFGALLIGFYALKIVCPRFIVGVAEIPRVVEFGNFVDGNLVAYYLFTIITSHIGGYIFTCACCRKKYLDKWDNIIILVMNIVPLVLYELLPMAYTPALYVCFIMMPTLVNIKNKSIQLSFNTILCYSIDQAFTSLSLAIRDISILVTYPNSATFTILLIDNWIWRGILYLFCNNKKEVI